MLLARADVDCFAAARLVYETMIVAYSVGGDDVATGRIYNCWQSVGRGAVQLQQCQCRWSDARGSTGCKAVKANEYRGYQLLRVNPVAVFNGFVKNKAILA